ncbi:lipid A deacylase LpxR family protein [Gluconobacter kanchanaburiensis]|uniref:lipid A deacylase LpxR family protein n=1 Tax=Gluconobacter kanchanaburiensis TaxID=563199 RepID=UPI0011BF73DD|nr:lipid A deacylase LpxR family protein [Gluconobacter kanchanaburiensis]MBF0861529.1 hypothetical protein [Gluconobacter kanchanaburiensis]
MQPADPHSIIVLQDENGFIATAFLTDRYYANGLRMGYTSYVSMISVVGEMALEKALIWDGVRFSYTQLFQMHEVHGQRSSMHKFGSRADGLWF